MRQERLNWAEMPLTGVFETQDGAVVLVGAFKKNPLGDICVALEIEDLSQQERLSTMEGMREHRAELQATFRKRFREETTAHWIERLEAQDLLCAPVRSLADALEDPQTAENGMLVESKNGHDDVLKMVGAPIHLSDAPFELRHSPPHLGEHSEAILEELGYDRDAVAKLREDGVLP